MHTSSGCKVLGIVGSPQVPQIEPGVAASPPVILREDEWPRRLLSQGVPAVGNLKDQPIPALLLSDLAALSPVFELQPKSQFRNHTLGYIDRPTIQISSNATVSVV